MRECCLRQYKTGKLKFSYCSIGFFFLKINLFHVKFEKKNPTRQLFLKPPQTTGTLRYNFFVILKINTILLIIQVHNYVQGIFFLITTKINKSGACASNLPSESSFSGVYNAEAIVRIYFANKLLFKIQQMFVLLHVFITSRH